MPKQADQKGDTPQKKTVTGTNADLRRLNLADAKKILRDKGFPEAEVWSVLVCIYHSTFISNTEKPLHSIIISLLQLYYIIIICRRTHVHMYGMIGYNLKYSILLLGEWLIVDTKCSIIHPAINIG